MRQGIANPLKPGDVIQTHPARGFWGCAIVLSARDGDGKIHPMCHIGIMTLITRRRYAWKDIAVNALELVRQRQIFRVAANEYYREPDERICIGSYSLASAAGLRLLGQVDPRAIYSASLDLDEVGDGTDGRFPFCGLVPDDLGHEAVLAWRQAHDAERLQREAAQEMAAFERLEAQRLAKAREARSSRKSRA